MKRSNYDKQNERIFDICTNNGGCILSIDVIWEWIEIANNEPTVDSVADSFIGLVLSLIITNWLLKGLNDK